MIITDSENIPGGKMGDKEYRLPESLHTQIPDGKTGCPDMRQPVFQFRNSFRSSLCRIPRSLWGGGPSRRFYFAYSMARVSRITLTLI